MINIRDYKAYFPYITICGFFIITAIAAIMTYLHIQKDLTAEDRKGNNISLEIKLPVIQWAKYEGLSKKYSDANMIK